MMWNFDLQPGTEFIVGDIASAKTPAARGRASGSSCCGPTPTTL